MSLLDAELRFYNPGNPYVMHDTQGDLEVLVPLDGADEDAIAWEAARSTLNQRPETADDRANFERWLKGGSAVVGLEGQRQSSNRDSSGFGEFTAVHPVNM